VLEVSNIVAAPISVGVVAGVVATTKAIAVTTGLATEATEVAK